LEKISRSAFFSDGSLPALVIFLVISEESDSTVYSTTPEIVCCEKESELINKKRILII
jgi:hypothetical protein